MAKEKDPNKKGFWKEFGEFISKGNVMDLAVAVIIGGAFTAIVTSLTTDILSPIIGLVANMNLDDLVVKFGDVQYDADGAVISGVVLYYGKFLTAVINFIIQALVIFCLVKGIKSAQEGAKKLMKKKEEEKPAEEPTTKTCPYCQMEIPIKATRCGHCTSELDK